MRTGHNRLNAHMYSKFNVGESEMCPCNSDVLTADHLLQHCQLHDGLRRDMWPEPKSLRDKLYCNPEELKRTAAFERATGISVKRARKKKINGHLIKHTLFSSQVHTHIQARARTHTHAKLDAHRHKHAHTH